MTAKHGATHNVSSVSASRTAGWMMGACGEQMTILTAMAMSVESIGEAKAEEARAAAEARLKGRLSAEEVASTNAALVWALAQLRVKHRHL